MYRTAVNGSPQIFIFLSYSTALAALAKPFAVDPY